MSQPSPDEIASALADATRFTKAGQDRARWPVWAAAVNAIATGLLVPGFAWLIGNIARDTSSLMAFTQTPYTVFFLLFCAASATFRSWYRAKSGTLAAVTGRDMVSGLFFLVGVTVACVLARGHDLFWPGWLIGVLYGADLFYRRRRTIVCPVVDHV